jgi:hypothetical protein
VEVVKTYFKALSQHMLGMTEENHDKSQSRQWSVDLPKYEMSANLYTSMGSGYELHRPIKYKLMQTREGRQIHTI